MLLLLFLLMNLTNSFFNFTIEFYTSSSNTTTTVLKFRSNTELDVSAFIYDNYHPVLPISIEREGSNEYYIDYTGYEDRILNIIINTPLFSLNEMFLNANQIKK